MMILNIILSLVLTIQGGPAYFKNLQQRDSILIADQFEYGFKLEGVEPGTGLAMSDFSTISNDTLTLVRNWQIDTLKTNKKTGVLDIKASVLLSPFEEGDYHLPPVVVLRTIDNQVDTLVFDAPEPIAVKTMPVDTATFVIHDIKAQMTYPLTFREIAPWVAGGILLIAVIIAIILYIRKKMAQRSEEQEITQEAAYIVALRELEKYRGDKLWVADKQKTYYSGITDILKTYIDNSFKIDAPEMTTAELFRELQAKDIDQNLYKELKDFFELADFVKFAKYIASDEDNAKALPLAVRFVTTTYQTNLEADQKALEEEQKK